MQKNRFAHKKAFNKNIYREITTTLNRFLAILAIVALGVGFLAGLLATTPDMRYSTDKYYDETNTMDIRIISTLGLTNDDVQALDSIEVLDRVMPSYSADVLLTAPSKDTLVTKIHSINPENANYINNVILLEGRLPQKAGECVIEHRNFLDTPVKIGDKLKASSENKDIEDKLSVSELEIVGIVKSAYYFSAERETSTVGNGTVSLIMYTTSDSFSYEVYTDIFATVKGAKEMQAFSDAYDDYIGLAIDEIDSIKENQIAHRYNSLYNEANEKLKDAQKEFDANKAKAESELQDTLNQINSLKEMIKIEANPQKLAVAMQMLDNGEKEYNKSKLEVDKKLATAQAELDAAKVKIDEIERPEWYILDRHYNLGYESFDSNSQKVEAIAKVFPIFFFLVAALVALTTMTRMVEEERTQIGTLKALGYGKATIIFKYILYAGLASVLGSILGLSVGFKLFPTVIWNAYEMMYSLPPLVTQFNLKYALISSITAIACTLLTTVAACYSTLMEAPAKLMQPRAPKAGKRVFLEYITPIWSRMKFTHKVTARNLIRYKKRFFMTVIGIAGCTALLVTGFGLRDSIGDIIYKQFNEIFKYNLIIGLKDSNIVKNEAYLKSIIDDKESINKYTTIYQEKATATSEYSKNKISTTITCIEDESILNDYITFRERKTGKIIIFDDSSIIVTEKLAERLNLRVGSTFTLVNSDNKATKFKVGGITENYLNGYVYIPHKLYEVAFSKVPDYNILIAEANNNSEEFRNSISTNLLKDENVSSVSFTDKLKNQFDNLLSKIDYIVVVLIISAGLLAFIVLYNLTNINITERQKEIATIKVLGFYDNEVSAYVFRETIILSIIGTLCGLIMGIFLHAFVVKTAEVDIVMFGRSIYPNSFIFSALLTMFFSILVNLFMNKKLKNIDMVESMKANE